MWAVLQWWAQRLTGLFMFKFKIIYLVLLPSCNFFSGCAVCFFTVCVAVLEIWVYTGLPYRVLRRMWCSVTFVWVSGSVSSHSAAWLRQSGDNRQHMHFSTVNWSSFKMTPNKATGVSGSNLTFSAWERVQKLSFYNLASGRGGGGSYNMSQWSFRMNIFFFWNINPMSHFKLKGATTGTQRGGMS